MPQQAGTHMYLQSVFLLIIHTNLSKDTNHYSARPYRTADQSTTDTLVSLVSLSLCRPSTSTGCALRGVCHHPGTHMYSQSVWSLSIHTNLSRDTTLYPNRITDTTPCCPSGLSLWSVPAPGELLGMPIAPGYPHVLSITLHALPATQIPSKDTTLYIPPLPPNQTVYLKQDNPPLPTVL